jgi:hypothetical protein
MYHNYHTIKTAQMEYLYTIHTKLIAGKIHFFVKKMMAFPEFEGLDNVLVGYGMHTDFEKACKISGIYDTTIRKQLLFDLEQRSPTKVAAPQPGILITMPKKHREKHGVKITAMVSWLAQRGAALLNKTKTISNI